MNRSAGGTARRPPRAEATLLADAVAPLLGADGLNVARVGGCGDLVVLLGRCGALIVHASVRRGARDVRAVAAQAVPASVVAARGGRLTVYGRPVPAPGRVPLAGLLAAPGAAEAA